MNDYSTLERSFERLEILPTRPAPGPKSWNLAKGARKGRNHPAVGVFAKNGARWTTSSRAGKKSAVLGGTAEHDGLQSVMLRPPRRGPKVRVFIVLAGHA